MAVTTGLSVQGLQRLDRFFGSGVGWQIRFASVQNLNRLERQGTALICVPASNNRFPVVAVYKLYGGGLAPETLNVPTYAPFEVWVNWFYANRSWVFDRPDT